VLSEIFTTPETTTHKPVMGTHSRAIFFPEANLRLLTAGTLAPLKVSFKKGFTGQPQEHFDIEE
jgi:hypothetical protein